MDPELLLIYCRWKGSCRDKRLCCSFTLKIKILIIIQTIFTLYLCSYSEMSAYSFILTSLLLYYYTTTLLLYYSVWGIKHMALCFLWKNNPQQVGVSYYHGNTTSWGVELSQVIAYVIAEVKPRIPVLYLKVDGMKRNKKAACHITEKLQVPATLLPVMKLWPWRVLPFMSHKHISPYRKCPHIEDCKCFKSADWLLLWKRYIYKRI